MIKNIWNYAISHKWSKDILRANFLYIVLVIIYDIFHFHLQPINWHFFFKTLVLMNLCLAIKLVLTILDQNVSQQDQWIVIWNWIRDAIDQLTSLILLYNVFIIESYLASKYNSSSLCVLPNKVRSITRSSSTRLPWPSTCLASSRIPFKYSLSLKRLA